MTELFIKLFKSLVLLGYLGSVLRAVGLQFGYLVIVFLYKVLALLLIVSVLNEVFLPCFTFGFTDKDIEKIEKGEISIKDVTDAIRGLKDEPNSFNAGAKDVTAFPVSVIP